MADPNSPDGPKGIYVLPECDTSGVTRKKMDLPYGTGSDFQKLDLYFPASEAPENGYPLVLFIHGGAWMMCDKKDEQLRPALKVLDEGYALAAVNYRLSSEDVFPAQIFDVKASVRWLRAKGAEYQVNTKKIVLWGDSAGAHLASLLGTSGGVDELEDLTMGNPGETSRVQGVVSWFGPTDFLKMDPYLKESGTGVADHGDADSPESRLFGAPIADVPELVKKANPETWLNKDCPPFLIQHGLKDPIVPYQLSVDFYNKISIVAGDDYVELLLLDDALHGGPEFETNENLEKVLMFIARCLKD